MASPFGTIQGDLPFPSGGGGLFAGLGQNPATAASQLGGAYQTAYTSALAQNQANYANVLAGYQQTAASQRTAQDALAGGYSDLAGRVQSQLDPLQSALTGQRAGYERLGHDYGRLSGSVQDLLGTAGEANRQNIYGDYAKSTGQMTQSLVNRGLGNTTVLDSAARGLEFDRNRALTANENQVAQLKAGYLGQIGLADLGARQQGITANTAQQNLLGQQRAAYESSLGLAGLGYQDAANQRDANLAQTQLRFQEGVQSPYPSADAYSQLAALYGQSAQAQAAQQQFQDAQRQLLASANRPVNPGSAQVGLGTGTPLPGPQGYYGPSPTYSSGGAYSAYQPYQGAGTNTLSAAQKAQQQAALHQQALGGLVGGAAFAGVGTGSTADTLGSVLGGAGAAANPYGMNAPAASGPSGGSGFPQNPYANYDAGTREAAGALGGGFATYAPPRDYAGELYDFLASQDY